MGYRRLLDDLHDHSPDACARDWLLEPSLSESEFAASLPDIFALGLMRRPLNRELRVGLLLRHYGLGACAPETVIEIARRDGWTTDQVHQALASARTVLCRGVTDLASSLSVLEAASPAFPADACCHPSLDHLSLQVAAQEVLALLWQMPRDRYPSGLEDALSRLSACCAGLDDTDADQNPKPSPRDCEAQATC